MKKDGLRDTFYSCTPTMRALWIVLWISAAAGNFSNFSVDSELPAFVSSEEQKSPSSDPKIDVSPESQPDTNIRIISTTTVELLRSEPVSSYKTPEIGNLTQKYTIQTHNVSIPTNLSSFKDTSVKASSTTIEPIETDPVPIQIPDLWFITGSSESFLPATKIDSLKQEISEKAESIAQSKSQTETASANSTDTELYDLPHFMSFEEWKEWKKQQQPPETPRKKADTAVPAQIEEKGRIYKDKFNYASGDCAATVVGTNSDAKGALLVLLEVKDTYLINKCSTTNKFVVIELCQDILVSEVVMGNFELFSLMFRKIRFSVLDRFPVKAPARWHVLGEVEALNARDLQHFPIENPLIWARYLKVEILLHYGDEFYCPISLVRVHGTTMMEEFKKQPEEPVMADYLANFSEIVDQDECKVEPYLALNQFLQDFHTDAYCHVSNQLVPTKELGTKTQELIFKNIVKRLELLESNATLSLLYVEEQSKLLSNAFANLEQRQGAKFNTLLLRFNQTVFLQINFFQLAYKETQGQLERLLRRQRDALSSVLADISRKNSQLASEVAFQRKIVWVNIFLLLGLFGYLVFTSEFSLEALAPPKKVRPRTVPRKRALKPTKRRNNYIYKN